MVVILGLLALSTAVSSAPGAPAMGAVVKKGLQWALSGAAFAGAEAVVEKSIGAEREEKHVIKIGAIPNQEATREAERTPLSITILATTGTSLGILIIIVVLLIACKFVIAWGNEKTERR